MFWDRLRPHPSPIGRAASPGPLARAVQLQGFSSDLSAQGCFLRQGSFRVYVLNGSNSRAEANGIALCGEKEFQFSNDGKKVVEIEIPEVSKPEDLAFHGALAVGDDGVNPVTVLLHDHPGIHA